MIVAMYGDLSPQSTKYYQTLLFNCSTFKNLYHSIPPPLPHGQVQAVVFAEDVSAGSVLLNGGLVSVCPSHISILEGFILTAKPSNRPGAIGAYDRAFKTAFGLFSDSESG